jgi:hypothetical protein
MSQELQNFDIQAWWSEQSFAGKELYKLDDNGNIVLGKHLNVPERIIANVTADNADTVIKNLVEKFEGVEARVKEMEVEWMATEDKLRLADKVSNLKDFLNHAVAIGDFEKAGQLVHDWEHTLYTLSEEVYQAKLKIAELAESLASGEQWKETTQFFKDVAEKWKQSGHLDRSRNEKLWNKIEKAREAFFERKRKHHEDEEKYMLQNLDLKMDLVEQAEALVSSTEWKKTTDTFHRLTAEWKTIGHTLNKKNEELWQRFMAAKGAFFDRKKEHSSLVQQEQEHNYEIKVALAEKAEALKDSTEWNATAQAYAALMEEWKKTGRVPHEKSDELWKRFTDAQEHFFEAKRQHSDKLRSSLENNYTQKKVLLERAEELKNSTHWGETTAEMVTLMEEWKKIGPVPREYGDKLWESFNAARKYFFARKDANREQRKKQFEAHKSARVQHVKNMVHQLEREIKEEEEKIEDFRNGLENITPGKKAEELRTHLETLIADCSVRLKRLHEKYEAAKIEAEATDKKEAADKKEEQADVTE